MIEYWDVYDKNRNKIDKVVQRGENLNEDEYHIVVCVWIRNEEGKFLISRIKNIRYYGRLVVVRLYKMKHHLMQRYEK